MIRAKNEGIVIEGTLLQVGKLSGILDKMREAAPLEHSLIVRHTDKIEIGKHPSAFQERTLILHQENLKTHPCWLASWILRFAAQKEGYEKQHLPLLQMQVIKKMLLQDKEQLSMHDLKFLERCAERLEKIN